MRRFTLTSLMVLIGVLALGLAAMRDGSDLTERAVFTLTVASLFVGLVGAYARRNDGAWAGFVICGWGYAILTFVPAIHGEVAPHLLIDESLGVLLERLLGPPPATPPAPTLSLQHPAQRGMLDPEQNAGYALQDPAFRSTLPLSEQKALDAYQVQHLAYQKGQNSFSHRWINAERIGHELLVLTFGLLGALLGRFLAARGERSIS